VLLETGAASIVLPVEGNPEVVWSGERSVAAVVVTDSSPVGVTPEIDVCVPAEPVVKNAAGVDVPTLPPMEVGSNGLGDVVVVAAIEG
jgi:hypothetical protein